MRTKTASFGSGKRENHDSSEFYSRNLSSGVSSELLHKLLTTVPEKSKSVVTQPRELWANKIYCASSERLENIPDASVGLAFTSPPYNVGKEYEEDVALDEYFLMIQKVAQEVYRVLVPGGRYVVNIANLGRKPYIPLHVYFYLIHNAVGFLTAGEIIWQKARGMAGSCAWGSWLSAKAPRLRDLHEYLLVFVKEDFSRPDVGVSNISREGFLQGTLSVWQIPAESAKRVGHPAPFPVELADRVLKLFSYQGDVILDPFMGSGTTCVAALESGRDYVGYDTESEYCQLAEKRLARAKINLENKPPIEK